MWIFGQTPWTDADQTFMIRTLLLTGCSAGMGMALRRWPGTQETLPPLLPLSTRRNRWLNREDVQWALVQIE